MSAVQCGVVWSSAVWCGVDHVEVLVDSLSEVVDSSRRGEVFVHAVDVHQVVYRHDEIAIVDSIRCETVSEGLPVAVLDSCCTSDEHAPLGLLAVLGLGDGRRHRRRGRHYQVSPSPLDLTLLSLLTHWFSS